MTKDNKILRNEDMDKLATAIIHEVAIGMGLPAEKAEQFCTVEVKVMIANRILGWVNHRLGLVSPDTMAKQVLANRQVSQALKYPEYCTSIK